MNVIDERLGTLIERLQADLCNALSPDGQAKLVLFRAAVELVCDDLQPQDSERLGLASSHLALQTLGVSDAAVERAKDQLRSGRDAETLNRRQ